ncbi:MAG: cell wall metabolism sensor histidine kinase WalK, partial [Clostridioides sp.]|nr:cell wall metabolism sensor histidine kinase WalK [Clostridioides sp.]
METNINNKRVHIHFQGLRKKVIKNYIVLVFIMVILFEILFTIYIQNSYYSSVEQQLQAQVNYTEWNYSSSTLGSVGFERKINTIFERQDSSKTAKFGVSFIDKNRNLVLDQYGFKGNNEKIYGEDVESALKNSDEHKPYIYRIKGTNEHVMSVSVAIKSNNIIYGAVRFTISLKEIDKAIVKQALIIGLSGFVILLIGVLISLRFAQTLVNPLIELKSLATQLANGNYKVKFNNVLHVDDEIGELAQTFEYMAHEIERGEKVKDEFISSISHELRTPLTSIKGWSETLSLDNITKDELSLGLGIIQDETSRLIRLVEELLDFSRLSSERIKIVFEEVDFAILVVGVINQL